MVRSLDTHPLPFLTPQELADYWSVSRRAILHLIETDVLVAVRFGPRSLRIRTDDARRFERRFGGPRADPLSSDATRAPVRAAERDSAVAPRQRR
jgi:excisionase family DNA binding protein